MAKIISFGKTKEGTPVNTYILRNCNGLEVHFINYGCRLTQILIPQQEGGPVDVLLGYDSLEGYEQDKAGHGAFIGRYAGRIIGGKFTIDGKSYQLPQNDGDNFLHGSLAHKVFKGTVLGDNSVSLNYTSPAGEDGFPGQLEVQVLYTLTDENELVMDIRAITDAPTYLNLTNHSYFNMEGQQSGTIGNQMLWLNSKEILEASNDLTATGQVVKTKNTPFDFTQEKPIGRDLMANDPQIELAGGFDHTFVLEKARPKALTLAAVAKDPASGRTMDIHTTQPAVQFYTGNFLGNGPAGKGGRIMTKQSGFCLETQHYPGSPNHTEFPTTLLRPDERFHEVTVYQFRWPQEDA